MRKITAILGGILVSFCITCADVSAKTSMDKSTQVAVKEIPANITQLQQLTALPLAQGRFEQKKYFTILKNPIVSSGEVYFDQQLGLIWQTLQPISSVIRLKKSGLYIEDVLSGQRKVQGADTITQVLMNALSGNISALRLAFTVQSLKNNSCVSLLPKDNLLANVMKSIDLCIVENKLSKIVLFEHSGNRTEISLRLFALNKLPEAISAQLQ